MDAFKSYTELLKYFEDFRDDPERTARLVARMRAKDEQAREDLIVSTLKFIAVLATAHCRRMNVWRDFDDLVQEGNETISNSIHLFDPAKSSSLERFIRARVKYAFIDYWYSAKAINRTSYRRQIERLIKRGRAELTSAFSREPTPEELAGHLEMDEGRVREFLNRGAIQVVGLGESEDENGEGSAWLDLASDGKTPFEQAELSEMPDIAIRCLGREDAELLLAYFERGTAYFQALCYKYRRKELAAPAARKYKQRLVRKLRDCLKKMSRLSARGGNHGSQGTPNRAVTQRIFNG